MYSVRSVSAMHPIFSICSVNIIVSVCSMFASGSVNTIRSVVTIVFSNIAVAAICAVLCIFTVRIGHNHENSATAAEMRCSDAKQTFQDVGADYENVVRHKCENLAFHDHDHRMFK